MSSKVKVIGQRSRSPVWKTWFFRVSDGSTFVSHNEQSQGKWLLEGLFVWNSDKEGTSREGTPTLRRFHLLWFCHVPRSNFFKGTTGVWSSVWNNDRPSALPPCRTGNFKQPQQSTTKFKDFIQWVNYWLSGGASMFCHNWSIPIPGGPLMFQWKAVWVFSIIKGIQK